MGKTLETYLGEVTAASATLDQTDGIPCLEDGSLRMAVPPQVSTAALWLPGSSGNYVSCPDAAGLDITGDICIVAKVALDDWTPGAATVIVGKRDGGTTKSYQFYVDTSGNLALMWSTDGSAETADTSTTPTGASNGTALWVAATLDVNNGASGYSVRFWTGSDGETWTQLGATVVGGSTTSIFASTSPLEIGSIVGGTALNLAGKVYSVSVRTGIGAAGIVGGTQVAYYDANLARGNRFRDAGSNLFTATGSAWALMAA
jgi:hypothetical protein